MTYYIIILLLFNSLFIYGQDPQSVIFKGKVIDDRTYQFISAAEINLVLDNDTFTEVTNQNGEFLFNNLKPNATYYLEINKKPYLFNSFLPTYSLNANKVIYKEYRIIPYFIFNESSIPIINFEKNKFDINSWDQPPLTGFINVLKDTEDIVINVCGYRSFDEMENVSLNRALTIRNYMMSQNIDSSRINLVDKGSSPRTIYPEYIYTSIPIESQTAILTKEYIESIKNENAKQEALNNQRVVTFEIIRNNQ
ncbi:MAG: hypothetical protein R6T91_04715 [Bacteroidales bacterium]